MKLHLLLFLLLPFLVAACAPPPVLRDDALLNDTSLISGDPCEAPCWNNITPGETSWRDALIIVEDDPRLVNVEVVEDPESDAQLINFNAPEGPQCCRVFSDDGETISAVLLLLAPEMRLGQVIDKFGEPQYITGGDVTSDQTLLSLVYPDVPLVVYVFAAGTAEGTLTANSEIIGAIYLTAADMDELLAATNLYLWDGYGPVSEYLDGNFDRPAEEPAEATEAVDSGQ